MPRKQKTKKNEWPCGRCKKNCVSSCVFCAICEKWYHCACESVTLDKLKIISDNPEDYICETCRSDDGKFDFLMGLERLKQPHKIPDLIAKINEISAIQFHDLRCALHGNGNYVLEDSLKQHKVAPDVWLKLSRSEKNRRVWKLLHQKPISNDKTNYIKSTNCSFQIPPTSKVAQKPCQRKRPKAERTRR